MDRVFIKLRGWLTLILSAISLTALIGIVRLEFDDVPRSVFRAENEDFRRLEQVFEEFGSDDNDCILVVEPAKSASVNEDAQHSDLFTQERINALRLVVEKLRQIEGVAQVRSLLDVPVVLQNGTIRSLFPNRPNKTEDELLQAKQDALAHPLVVGQLLSSDANTTLILVQLQGQSLGISQIKPRIEAIKENLKLLSVNDQLRIRITGVPAIRTEIYETVIRESKKFVVIGVILAASMSLALFRRFWAVIIVALPPILGSFWTMGAMGLLGEKLNIINTIVPTLVMIIGFTNAVHLMHHLRSALASGLSPLDAAGLTVKHLWFACLLTALTTAVGFGSLGVAEVDIIRRFGWTCAIGTMIAFLAVITTVPLLASVLSGERIAQYHLQKQTRWTLRAADFLVDWVLRHHRTVTVLGVAGTAVMFWVALHLEPDNRLTEAIPTTNSSSQALAHCDQTMGGAMMVYALVEWSETLKLESPEVMSVIAQVQHSFDQESGTQYPMSVINLLRSIPGSSNDLASRVSLLAWLPQDVVRRFVRTDLRKTLVSAHIKDVGTSVHRRMFERLEIQFAEISQKYPNVDISLTGSVPVAGRNINQMIVDLASSLLLASVVIFVALTIGFRSWLYGLLSIIPNVFPLVLTATVLVVTGKTLQLTGVIVFSICLGIAVDDTIHFLARFRRELAIDRNVHEAVRRSCHSVGAALVTTTLVLLTGFGSVLTSEMPPSRLFAWMSCVAIAAALIGDLLILPSLLAWFGLPSNRSSKGRLRQKDR